MGHAKFSIQGAVCGQPTWIQGKNGSSQTLELRFRVDSQTYSGQQRQDFIQVRFGRNSQDAARELVPGTLAELMGTISGRLWNGERGEKVFNDFNCTEFMVLARPQYQPSYQGYAQPSAPPQGVAEEDVRYPAPAPADYSDTPF